MENSLWKNILPLYITFVGVFTEESILELEKIFDTVYMIPKKEWMSKLTNILLN